jgi:hypothetical protein
MLPTTLGLVVYIIVLILPLIVLLLILLRKARLRWAVPILLSLFMFACPAYYGLLLFGEVWPPDLIPFNHPRFTAQIPGYTVVYEQHYSGDYYVTVLQLTDVNGRTGRSTLDGDAERCWDMKLVQQQSKYYFVCANEPDIDVGTTYIDVEKQELYIGIAQRSFPLPTFFDWK